VNQRYIKVLRGCLFIFSDSVKLRGECLTTGFFECQAEL